MNYDVTDRMLYAQLGEPTEIETVANCTVCVAKATHKYGDHIPGEQLCDECVSLICKGCNWVADKNGECLCVGVDDADD